METFYLHTLRYYITNIIKHTYDTYELGVGIFTMQGSEHRNKESTKNFRITRTVEETSSWKT